MNAEKDLCREYEGASLGDQRRAGRLSQLASALVAEPSASLPQSASSDAELEACYRFLNNEQVSVEALMAPHQRQTVQRASAHAQVWVLHDTTCFRMCDEDTRAGLGPLVNKQGRRGFYAHVSMVMAPTEVRDPLGVMATYTYVRAESKVNGQRKRNQVSPESHHWAQGVDEAEAALRAKTEPIHVMDRQADSYALLSRMMRCGQRFVLRAKSDRTVCTAPPTATSNAVNISEALSTKPSIAQRQVVLSVRKDKGRAPYTKKMHPARPGRQATLSIRAGSVYLRRPREQDKHLPKQLMLNLVHVVEVDPPQGQQPVSWLLLSSEPIDTQVQVLQLVDIYRSRWCIEELFKAMKTGCQFEKRQLRSYDALCRMLAILWPIAWRMLRMRFLATEPLQRPATDVLSETQLRILRAVSRRVRLDTQPTLRQAFAAVAGLGGHLQRNGAPGWITLGRGWERLLLYELGYQLHQ